MKRILIISVLSCVTIAIASGQTDPATLLQNQRRMDVSVDLDRSEYFPGEVITMSLKVKNPTNQTRVIPAPFRADTGAIQLYQRLGDGQFEEVSPNEVSIDQGMARQPRF